MEAKSASEGERVAEKEEEKPREWCPCPFRDGERSSHKKWCPKSPVRIAQEERKAKARTEQAEKKAQIPTSPPRPGAWISQEDWVLHLRAPKYPCPKCNKVISIIIRSIPELHPCLKVVKTKDAE